MSTNLDEVIGLCRICNGPLGESPPPACATCVGQDRRHTRKKESDPYKKVWNTVEDEEAILLEWVKNGTLFVPTPEELALRHVATARYLLKKARDVGPFADYDKRLALFEEAMFHRNMAKEMFDKHHERVLKSR